MNINFDQEIDRRKTNDLKWQTSSLINYLNFPVREDMIPMWVADMDFAAPQVVVEAIQKRAEQQIYGYCAPRDSFYQAIVNWLEKKYSWNVSNSWIYPMPSVVSSINVSIRAFSNPGDGIIIQQPVYEPIAGLIKQTGRNVVNNALICHEGYYEMDFSLLEQQAAIETTKIMILCSPHNPVGRVWTKEELQRVDDICQKHGVLVVSDEIHADIVYKGATHTPFATLSEQAANNSIICISPSKAFNIAGLKMSSAIIQNEDIRNQFIAQTLAMSLDVKNTFGIEAVIAAYSDEGEAWLDQLLLYLNDNINFIENFVALHMPGVQFSRPEGTYLCWLNMTDVRLSDEELIQRVIFQAGVVCVPGQYFGLGGEKHIRLNIGCTRKNLQIALTRIQQAVFPTEG